MQRDSGPVLRMQDLFDAERIPKIVVAGNGSVLAFARGCQLLRRSDDQGCTWGEIQQVGEGGSGNAIIDETNGNVLIVCPGSSLLWRSADFGETWGKEDIVLKPNAFGHGTPDGVRSDTGASESGMCLRSGAHVGRLLIPVRIQPPKGSNDQEYWAYNYNAAIYSDDGGRTWQTSDPVQSGTGEGTLAELNDGRIYYNSRSHMAVDHRRQIAWSHDGGHMWTDWQVSEDLYEIGEPFYFKYGTKPSYGCNAGLVRVPPVATGGKDVLVFSMPDNPGSTRVQMTVWASFDGAQTWPLKRLIYEGPSAYSSLTADGRGNIFLLFERGEKKLYEKLTLARFHLSWLTEGQS